MLKVGQGKAFKNKWIKKDGDRLVRLVASVQDQTRIDLQIVQRTGAHPDAETVKELRKRKLCDKSKEVFFRVRKGPKFALTVKKQATDVTVELLQR